MSNKQNDIFYEAIQEIKEEKASKVKDWQFINWICSKEEILSGENEIDPISGDDDKYDLERENKDLIII